MISKDAPKLAVFRVDASPDIGAGHVMRCLALADTLAARGWRCAFASQDETINTVSALANSGHALEALDSLDDAGALRGIWPSGCDLLVVDHYQLDAVYESACRNWAPLILVIDDLANRPHDCDVLLDQTVGRSADDYKQLSPPSCRDLTGSSYALLRSQFALTREAALTRRQSEKSLRRVLVSCGATDPHNVTMSVLKGMALAAPGLKIDVAIGGAAPHLPELRREVKKLGLLVDIYVDCDDMAGLMLNADLAIGAAGTSAWERCCLGLPTLMVISADNQRTVAKNLVESGAAIIIGDYDGLTPEVVAAAFREIVMDVERLDQMRTAAALQCNGLGARLLASIINQHASKDGKAVFLRPGTQGDSEIIFDWQQQPETRRFSHNPAVPVAHEHAVWMTDRLEDPDCIFLVIEHGGKPAGVLRLDWVEIVDGGGRGYRVSIFVDPDKHHLGIGTAALLQAEELVSHTRLIAEVLPDNQASHAVFHKAGFEKHDGYYTWEIR